MFPIFIFLLTVASSLRTDLKDNSPYNIAEHKLIQHAEELKHYAEKQGDCCGYGILVDMSIPSSMNRFFVVDFKNDSVLIAGLCAHGGGRTYHGEKVIFSNEVGSFCTSEGRYRIGSKYYGTFGLSYRLYGIDTSNNKAFERAVVLHSMSCIPDTEGESICMSNGCPMVSPHILKEVSALLDASDKPVLLWIYK